MKTISSEELLRTPIFWITRDVAIDPDGFEITRAIVQHGGSAVVMPVDEKGRVLLVKQYRLPARRYMWELCAGRMDPGEKVLQTAKRELQEETGLRAKKITKLAEFWVSPGFLSEHMTLFLATGLTAGEQKPMDDERIETRWFTAAEIEKMIDSGKIPDAKTQIGFYRWQALLKKQKRAAAAKKRTSR